RHRTNGRITGDRLLSQVAAGLKSVCREYDYAARLAGDEFVLVMPGLKAEGIRSAVRRLSSAAVAAGREVCGAEVVTLSVGHAVFPDDGADAEGLLAEADRSMYKVKRFQKLLAASPIEEPQSAEQPAV
ncbi:MAG: GGDEF domain-containing protein, partial [Acidobacteria bacterium]|nr:GGDEF domain-containing protein [Acidobacteriota bacterium]